MDASFVTLTIPTDAGRFVARYSAKGLAGLNFPSARTTSPRTAKPATMPAAVHRWHQTTETALKSILAGHSPKKFPPMDWTGKTQFQKAVWRAMLKIPVGRTKSYGEMAQAIGRPKAGRAVGGACGANPIPVLVPCHRVLAANRKIGGFSSGLSWKRELLAREGISL